MQRAGFVLVGGKSTRMGRDKALLSYRGAPLAGHVAALVQAAAGTATLVGPAEPYRRLGFPVVADMRPGQGPLAGIETALRATAADWNLVVACDMPGLSDEFLRALLEAAEASAGADCVLACNPAGMLEPLCAVYHRRCLPALSAALDRGIRKVTDGLAGLVIAPWAVADAASLVNANTPAEWTRYEGNVHG